MRLPIGLIALISCSLFSGCNTGPEPARDPIEMKGGMPENTFADITIAGSGFQRFDGDKLFIRIGGPTPMLYPRERTAAGRVAVSQGAFRLEFRKAREAYLYKPFAFFFDVNGDGKCTVGGDVGYQGATGGGVDPYVFQVEDWMLYPMSSQDCGFMDGPWMD